MDSHLLNNVLSGLVQGEDIPVRVRLCGSDNKPQSVAYDIERIEIIDGVAYMIVNSAVPNIVPASTRES